MEIWKDPSVLIVYLIVILLFIIVFTFLFFLLHQKSLKKILDTELKRSKAEVLHQKNIVKISVDVQEEERKRIARIIHDDIGNRVHILSVWLNNPEAWQSERAKEIILKQLPALSEATRTVSHALYPVDVEHIGLIATLEEMAVNVSASLNVQLVLLHLYQAPSLAIEKVHETGIFLTKDDHQMLLNYVRDNPKNQKLGLSVSLSDREVEVVQLICREFTNQEISDQLFISKRTVESHRQRILEKIGAKNTVGIVIYAIAHAIYTPQTLF